VTLPTAAQAPLSDELMRKVRRIEISTRRLVDEGVAGEYHSVFKGRGMEFSEVRPYQPGDDIRSIDWNVTARMGTPFVKQYVESRDLTVFVVVDVSGSQNFGSRTILKREQAAEIAALLSFAALRNQDRVGAALISDRLELFLPPRRSRTHVLRVVREILSRQGHGETDLDAAMPAVLRNLKQRSVLFLISDFVNTQYSDALKAAKGRHDVVTIQVSDPRDREIPSVGPIPIRDSETGRVAVLAGKRWASAYQEQRIAQHEALLQWTRKLSIDHLELRTDRPYIGALVSFFDRRRKRLQR